MPVVAVNVWYHVGSANERPGPHRLCASLRAPDVRGIQEREGRRVRHAARGGRRQQQRLHHEPTGPTTTMDLPSNALELALFLESDRMGYLLDTMTPERVDGQRDVVKNERRQSYREPAVRHGLDRARQDAVAGRPPVQLADHRLHGRPDGREPRGRRRSSSRHTTRRTTPAWWWPATSTWRATQKLVEKWFGEIPKGADVTAGGTARRAPDQREAPDADRSGASAPAVSGLADAADVFAPGDAALDVLSSVLAGGKNSRLYKRLVYDMQMAQDVSAYPAVSAALGSSFQIVATARPGHTDRGDAEGHRRGDRDG